MTTGTESQRSERVRTPTPASELERRWSAIREAMGKAGIEALVVHNHVDNLGGYVKYFSDFPAQGGYPTSVVFPHDQPMTIIGHGPHNAARELSPVDDPFFYGVGRFVSTWSFATASYTARYDAEQLVQALKPYADGTIGIVGYSQIPFTWVEHLKAELPHAEFVDANPIIDPIKAVKSEYEKQAIEDTIEMQADAFREGLNVIRPGRREWEVAADLHAFTHRRGSYGGVLLIGSAPAGASGRDGQSAMIAPPRHQNRVLQPGDELTLLVEVCNEAGYYAEIGRAISIGPASDQLLAENEFAREAWDYTVAGLRPGASPKDVFTDYNNYMREHNHPIEERVHSHGQGYDLVERPLVRSDDPMPLAEDMFLAAHPAFVNNGVSIFLCDNVFIGPDGATGPLHGIEQKVFEV